jgi:hypothetical protein
MMMAKVIIGEAFEVPPQVVHDRTLAAARDFVLLERPFNLHASLSPCGA